MMLRYLRGLLGAFALLLGGCMSDIHAPPAPNATVTGAAIGAVGGAVVGSTMASAPVGAYIGGVAGSAIGNYIGKHQTDITRLESYGGQVFQNGDEVKIIVPTHGLFMANSPALNSYAKPELELLVRLLAHYPTAVLHVSVFNDAQPSLQRSLALTQTRAEVVANYLWTHGVDTRLLHWMGYGSCHFVANNDTAAGRAANQRLEISLRVLED